jgi:hypothetical protein
MRTTGIIWRNTARPVRFFLLDARVTACIAVWLIHICWETFWFSIAGMVLFTIIERFGLSPKTAWRMIRLAPFSDIRTRRSLYSIRREARW